MAFVSRTIVILFVSRNVTAVISGAVAFIDFGIIVGLKEPDLDCIVWRNQYFEGLLIV